MQDKTMLTPPVGAADPRLTVPVDAPPPMTEAGEKVSDISFGGCIVRVALAELVPEVATMDAFVVAPTGVVETVKPADFAPDGTITESGTDAAEFDELKDTANPAVPAFEEMVTVPTAELPPPRVEGVICTDLTD